MARIWSTRTMPVFYRALAWWCGHTASSRWPSPLSSLSPFLISLFSSCFVVLAFALVAFLSSVLSSCSPFLVSVFSSCFVALAFALLACLSSALSSFAPFSVSGSVSSLLVNGQNLVSSNKACFLPYTALVVFSSGFVALAFALVAFVSLALSSFSPILVSVFSSCFVALAFALVAFLSSALSSFSTFLVSGSVSSLRVNGQNLVHPNKACFLPCTALVMFSSCFVALAFALVAFLSS